MDLPEIYKDPNKKGVVTHPQKQALELFLKYHTLAQIAELVDAPLGTVRDWVYVGRNGMLPMVDIRASLEKDMLKEIAEHRMPALKSIADSGLCLISNNLANLKKSGRELEIDDIKKVSDIIGNMDKLMRLDEGLSTDNVSIANVNLVETIADVKEALYEIDTLDVLGLHDQED